MGLREISVEGRVILKRILKKNDEGVDCINLAQDRIQLWNEVNTVTKSRVP